MPAERITMRQLREILRYLLGRLRHRRFLGLAELNRAIQKMLADINEHRLLRRLGVTRCKLLEDLDRPVLKPLPAEPYVYAQWCLRRAGHGYHVEVKDHYYSVPYRSVKSILDDWGLQPLGAAACHDLLEIVEERHGRRPTIITSQPPVEQWHAMIGDPTFADAILDRLVHNANRIDLAGDSIRKTRPRAAKKD